MQLFLKPHELMPTKLKKIHNIFDKIDKIF